MTLKRKKDIEEYLTQLNLWEHEYDHMAAEARAKKDPASESVWSKMSTDYGNKLQGAIGVLIRAGLRIEYVDTKNYKTDHYVVEEE